MVWLKKKLSLWKRSKTSSVEPFLATVEEAETEEEHKGESHAFPEVALAEVASPSLSGCEEAALAALPPEEVVPPLPSPACTDAAGADLKPESTSPRPPQASTSLPEASPRPPEGTPPSSCLPSLDQDSLLRFDLPLEAVYDKVGEAFGHMVSTSLQSSKWDKRAQALKALSSTLKGLEMQCRAPPGSTGALGRGLRLRDRADCWRLSCLVLHQVLRDKVIPIRLAALELYMDAFLVVSEDLVPQAEVHRALSVLVEHLLDRLGDSNLRLHESARRCVLFTAERQGLLGLGSVLAKLRARLGKVGKNGDRAKVHFGILDTVNFLLQHFPGSRSNCHIDEDLDDEADVRDRLEEDSWTQHDIASFIIIGMDDSSGPRVRDSAATLAVTVYQTFGVEAMRPILAELRPAKQALLKQKFEEFEGFDPDEDRDDVDEMELRPADLDRLVICGSAIKPEKKAAPAPQLPGSVNVDFDEEHLMDGILEDTGMVFHGTGMLSEAGGLSSAGQSMRLPPGFLESQFGLSGVDLDEEDHRFLEEEFMNLGFADMDCLAEQEALLMSLQNEHQSFNHRTNGPLEVF